MKHKCGGKTWAQEIELGKAEYHRRQRWQYRQVLKMLGASCGSHSCGSMQLRKHAAAEVCRELVRSLQTLSHDSEWQQLGIAQGHGIPTRGTYTE